MNKHITCPHCHSTSALNHFGDPTHPTWAENHPSAWYSQQEAYLCRASYPGTLIHASKADLASIKFVKRTHTTHYGG